NLTPVWPERHYWELTAFQRAAEYSYQIGYLCDTFKKQMIDPPFNVPESSLFSFRAGIICDKYLHQYSFDEIANELTERSIPLDKQILFSIGSANYLKGQDIVLEVYRCLKPTFPELHLVLLAPKSGYGPEFIELLKKRNQEENLNATIIETFDPNLAVYIYQWPLTNLIFLLSREDIQPLTVMEARANPQKCVVLVSSHGGTGAQVLDGKDGFICNIDGLPKTITEPLPYCSTMEEIVEKTKFILNLRGELRDEIIQNGKKLIAENYNMRDLMKDNLLRLITEQSISLKDPASQDSH
ncbi:glycosyltransferase, partial [Candidatus Pacearchaeota archaeon]|nr:glycosyltransferase [Candidatus Pacearchaeota archaeon]